MCVCAPFPVLRTLLPSSFTPRACVRVFVCVRACAEASEFSAESLRVLFPSLLSTSVLHSGGCLHLCRSPRAPYLCNWQCLYVAFQFSGVSVVPAPCESDPPASPPFLPVCLSVCVCVVVFVPTCMPNCVIVCACAGAHVCVFPRTPGSLHHFVATSKGVRRCPPLPPLSLPPSRTSSIFLPVFTPVHVPFLFSLVFSVLALLLRPVRSSALVVIMLSCATPRLLPPTPRHPDPPPLYVLRPPPLPLPILVPTCPTPEARSVYERKKKTRTR